MIRPDWASDVQYSGIFLQGGPFFSEPTAGARNCGR